MGDPQEPGASMKNTIARRTISFHFKTILRLFISMLAWYACMSDPALAQSGSSRYALLIAGLGGSPEYTKQYQGYLYETRKALIERFSFASENITVLAESPAEGENIINDVSSAENITAALSKIANKATARDDVYIILFGHGSYDGKNAMLNIPRQDLKDAEYAVLVDKIKAHSIVFINTTSCSAPFIAHLSGTNRIVMTATKSATERNDTVFPRFLVEAFTSEASDSDKNGDLSLLEVFRYTSERTELWYKESNHLATEHPLLEDTGDKRGYSPSEMADTAEGINAGALYILDRTRTMTAAISSTNDSVLVGMYEEQLKVNQEISQVKAEKANYSEKEYFAKLEPLFVRLARLTGNIEERQAK
jgi:hypothetical protein